MSQEQSKQFQSGDRVIVIDKESDDNVEKEDICKIEKLEVPEDDIYKVRREKDGGTELLFGWKLKKIEDQVIQEGNGYHIGDRVWGRTPHGEDKGYIAVIGPLCDNPTFFIRFDSEIGHTGCAFWGHPWFPDKEKKESESMWCFKMNHKDWYILDEDSKEKSQTSVKRGDKVRILKCCLTDELVYDYELSTRDVEGEIMTVMHVYENGDIEFYCNHIGRNLLLCPESGDEWEIVEKASEREERLAQQVVNESDMKMENGSNMKVDWKIHYYNPESERKRDIDIFNHNKPNQEKFMDTLKKIPRTLKRVLSSSKQAQYKAGYIDGDLKLTEKGQDVLLNLLNEEGKYEEAMGEIAQEEIDEVEGNDKKKKK